MALCYTPAMIEASAPGKIILFGEHAVVYGRPAIAGPVAQVRATATVTPGAPGSGLVLRLPDIGEQAAVTGASAAQPLAYVAHLTLASLSNEPMPDWTITLRSTIPVASGLGSGAAAATAIVRAIALAAGQAISPDQVSALVYESEKFFHGTPSGIDNTVIAYEQPVWFVAGQSPEPFAIGRPLTIVIADTGIACPTRVTVGDVRRGWQAAPTRYEALFDAVGQVAQAARQAIEAGEVDALGLLMDENHRLLQVMGVSSGELDMLCAAARASGALGAKLSGGGRGGNMIALAHSNDAQPIAAGLLAAGARRVLTTLVEDGAPT